MIRARQFIVACTCLVLASPGGQLFSHGSGASFEVMQNEILVDIGYTPEEFVAGERVRLDLDLYDLSEYSNPPLPFTNVWLRLTQGGRVFFSGNLYNPARTQTVATLQLPPAGEYELSARFYTDDSIVADAVFPVTVVTSGSVVDLNKARTSPNLLWPVTLHSGIIAAAATLVSLVFFAGLLVGRAIRKSEISA